MHFTRTFCLFLCCLPLCVQAAEWEVEKREAGVVVSVMEVPERDLPVFKGVGLVKAPMTDVLSVLSDTPRRTEWVYACSASEILKQVTKTSRIIYNKTASPWPVSDRDMIVRTHIELNTEKKEVLIPFKEAPEFGYPEQDGVVRVPRIRGFYRVEYIAEEETRVTYQVDADPGGMLPTWLARMASIDLPLKTLVGLRKQVAKTRRDGDYKPLREKWKAALSSQNDQGTKPPQPEAHKDQTPPTSL